MAVVHAVVAELVTVLDRALPGVEESGLRLVVGGEVERHRDADRVQLGVVGDVRRLRVVERPAHGAFEPGPVEHAQVARAHPTVGERRSSGGDGSPEASGAPLGAVSSALAVALFGRRGDRAADPRTPKRRGAPRAGQVGRRRIDGECYRDLSGICPERMVAMLGELACPFAPTMSCRLSRAST